MQRDDSANPGMLWVRDGEALWSRKAGPAERACADCHGDAETTMRGVAARYPAFDARRPGGRSTSSSASTMPHGAPGREAPAAREPGAARRSSAYRRAPVARPADRAADDERLAPFRDKGRALLRARARGSSTSPARSATTTTGAGGSAAAPIPQGHPTGYPLYRLEWQGLGSLQRRLRNCIVGVRAEPFPYGAPEYVDLELYLASRAAGMTVETPAVRP